VRIKITFWYESPYSPFSVMISRFWNWIYKHIPLIKLFSSSVITISNCHNVVTALVEPNSTFGGLNLQKIVTLPVVGVWENGLYKLLSWTSDFIELSLSSFPSFSWAEQYHAFMTVPTTWNLKQGCVGFPDKKGNVCIIGAYPEVPRFGGVILGSPTLMSLT
jgi:hypothetical protein